MSILLASNFDSVFSEKINTVRFPVDKEEIDKDKELGVIEESFVKNLTEKVSELIKKWYSDNKKELQKKNKKVLDDLEKVLVKSRIVYQEELWKLWNLSFFLGENHSLEEINNKRNKSKNFRESNSLVEFANKDKQEQIDRLKEREISNQKRTQNEIEQELEIATKRRVSPELLQRNKFGQTYLELRNEQIVNSTNKNITNQVKEAVVKYFNSSSVDREARLLRSIAIDRTRTGEEDSQLKLVNEIIYRTQQQSKTKSNTNEKKIEELKKQKESNKKRIGSINYTDDKIEDLKLDLATQEYIDSNPSKAKELRRNNLSINNEIEKYKNTLLYRLNNQIQNRIDKLENQAEEPSIKEYIFGKNNSDSRKIFGEYREKATLEELYSAKAKITGSTKKVNYNFTHSRIAVTETSLAYNLGRLKRFKEEGITHVQWRTDREYIDKQGRKMPCQFCRDRNYKIVSIQYVFDSFNKGLSIRNPANWSVPVHPNCFIPGTKILLEDGFTEKNIENINVNDIVYTDTISKIGKVTALSKRLYKGLVIEIKLENDTKITSTDLHPHFDGIGFRSADSFRVGERVYVIPKTVSKISQRDSRKVCSTEDSYKANRQNIKSKQSICSKSITNITNTNPNTKRSCCEPVGEQYRKKGKSEFKSQTKLCSILGNKQNRSKLFTADDRKQSNEEPGNTEESILIYSTEQTRVPLQNFEWKRLLQRRQTRRLGKYLLQIIVGSKLRKNIELYGNRLEIRTRNNRIVDRKVLSSRFLSTCQKLICRNQGIYDARRKRKIRFISDRISRKEFITDYFFDLQVPDQGFQTATPIRIVEINKKYYEGYVYNFAVEKDEVYIANSVITHNCRCSLYPVRNADNKDKRKVGETIGIGGLGGGILAALSSITTANTQKENKETSRNILLGALGVTGGVLSVALAYKLFGKFLESGKSLDVIKTIRESLPFFVKKSEIPKKTLANIPDAIKNINKDLIDIESLSSYIDPKRTEFLANQIYRDILTKGDNSTLNLADRQKLKQIIDDYIAQNNTSSSIDLPELNLPLGKLELPEYEGVLIRNITEDRIAANLEIDNKLKPLDLLDRKKHSTNVSSSSKQKYERIKSLIDQYQSNLDREISDKNTDNTIEKAIKAVEQIETQYSILSEVRQNATELKFDIENSIVQLRKKLNDSNINPLVEGFYDVDKNALSDKTKSILQSIFDKIKKFNIEVKNTDINLDDKKEILDSLTTSINDLKKKALSSSNKGELKEQRDTINSLINEYRDYISSQSTSIDSDSLLKESLNINKLEVSLDPTRTRSIDVLEGFQQRIGLKINQIEDTDTRVETSGLKESIAYSKSEVAEASKLLNQRPYTLTYRQYLDRITDPKQREIVEQTYRTRKEIEVITENISDRLENLGNNYNDNLDRINTLADNSLKNLISDPSIRETIFPNSFNLEVKAINDLLIANQNNPEGKQRAIEYIKERYNSFSSIEGSVFDENNKEEITKLYKNIIEKYSNIKDSSTLLEQLSSSTNGINSLDINIENLNDISGIAKNREVLVKNLSEQVKKDATDLKTEIDSLTSNIATKKQVINNKITWLKNIRTRVQTTINQSTEEYNKILQELEQLVSSNQISNSTKEQILAGIEETNSSKDALDKIDLAISKLEGVKKGIVDREKIINKLNVPTNTNFIPSLIEDPDLSNELTNKLDLTLNLGFSDDLLQSLSTIDRKGQSVKLSDLPEQLENIISPNLSTRKNKVILLEAWSKLEQGNIKVDSFDNLLKNIGFSIDKSGNKVLQLRNILEDTKLKNLSTNQRNTLKSLTNSELEILISASETGVFDLIKEYKQIEKQSVDLGIHSANILEQIENNYIQILRQPPYNIDTRIVFGEGGSVGLVTRELSPNTESPIEILNEIRKRLGIVEDGTNAPLINTKKGISNNEELRKKIAEIVKSPENYVQAKYLQTELLNDMSRIDDRLAVLNFTLSTKEVVRFEHYTTKNTKIKLLTYNKVKLLRLNP